MREKDPDVFGPGGGSSKMFALTEISFNVGLIFGPVICGLLSEHIGFKYTAWVLGKHDVFRLRTISLTSCSQLALQHL